MIVPGTEAGNSFWCGARDPSSLTPSRRFPLRQRVLKVAENVSVWPIFDRERDDRWSLDGIVLMGDACHPMRPYMAAGGAMAIEDGAILARSVMEFDDPTEAFACYAATRIPRVAEVQRISIENSWMRGPTETDWFYCYDPCTAELKRSN